MAVDGIVHGNDLPHFLHGCILKAPGLDAGQNFGTVGCGEEFAFGVEQLEGVPFDRVVRGRQDDAAVAAFPGHHDLDGRCGGET